jgi:hypothetical protein
MRYLLIFVMALSVVGSMAGCSYSNLYKNYNDLHDYDEDDIPKSRTTTNASR